MKPIKTATSLASAAALLAMGMMSTSALADGTVKSISAGDKVECYGINSCKATSECKSGDHACKGLNACKGMGFKTTTAKECLAAKGKILL